MKFEFLAQLIGGEGPIHSFMVGLALILMVIAASILFMELSGYTISRRGLVKHGVRWNAQAISIAAVCAAIYIALVPISIAWVPGVGGFTPARALPAIVGSLFGLPGALGITFSMPIGDAISGKLTLGSVAGFLAQVYVTWIPYKMVRDPSMRSLKSIVSYYLWGIIVAPLIIAIMVPGWLDFVHVVPPAVAWGAVTPAFIMSYTIAPAVISPILLFVLYPLAKQWGLYFRDKYVTPLPASSGTGD